MLEAHLLSHIVAASLTAAQPATPVDTALAPVLSAQPAAPATAPAVDPASAPAVDPTTTPDTTPAAIPDSTSATATPATEIQPDVPGQRDPLEGINRLSYKISQPVDRFIFRPAAIAYKTVIPHPLRDGLRNFIRNLFEPLVFFNDVVQLRPKRALHTVSRMALNTILGLGGVFDVAKRPPFHLLHHDNGFGDTLGYYGVGPIAYIYLPVLGPTTVRDMVGGIGDSFAEPRLFDRIVHPNRNKPLLRTRLHVGKYSAILEGVEGLDRRAEVDAELETIRRTSVDPYASLRSSFLQDRAGEIAGLKAKNGQAPLNPSLEDPLLDPAGK
jgi:phospholipid-binding lipoprotein MlaA